MDSLCKEYSTDAQTEALNTRASYLKLISIPTMFDIGCSHPDPSQEYLTLNMVDEKTF